MRTSRILIGLLIMSSMFACNQKAKTSNLVTGQNTIETDSKQELEKDTLSFKFTSNDFQDFYKKFITDTVFQLSRVKFPLKGQYEDYDGKIQWEKESWMSIKWDFRNEMNNSDDSISIKQDNNKFFYGAYCRDCGFSFEMEFEKINGDWFMIYRQENNY